MKLAALIVLSYLFHFAECQRNHCLIYNTVPFRVALGYGLCIAPLCWPADSGS